MSARPFDPAEVAAMISAGHRIQLGDHLTLQIVDGDYVATCLTCECEDRVPFKPASVAVAMGRSIDFILRHQHREAWS